MIKDRKMLSITQCNVTDNKTIYTLENWRLMFLNIKVFLKTVYNC